MVHPDLLAVPTTIFFMNKKNPRLMFFFSLHPGLSFMI